MKKYLGPEINYKAATKSNSLIAQNVTVFVNTRSLLKNLNCSVKIQGVPEYMNQFQNFIKNKQVKIQRKLKYFLKGYEMPFQFNSLLQVVLKLCRSSGDRQCRCSFEVFLEN